MEADFFLTLRGISDHSRNTPAGVLAGMQDTIDSCAESSIDPLLLSQTDDNGGNCPAPERIIHSEFDLSGELRDITDNRMAEILGASDAHAHPLHLQGLDVAGFLATFNKALDPKIVIDKKKKQGQAQGPSTMA